MTPRVSLFGDSALLVEFGSSIDAEINARVLALAGRMRERAWPAVVDIVPSYGALAVHFDPFRCDLEALWRFLESAADAPVPREPAPVGAATHRIPVCYGGAFGPDLEAVAGMTAATEEEVIARHTAVEYRVYMLGFLPGFAYLGMTDERLEVPRRAAPTAIPAGSVGLAGRQTGIYPRNSPGGWQIIGRTPLRLFDVTREPPARFAPGERVVFEPVSEARYHAEQSAWP